ncbi:M48 family metalloprotease [Tsukamurella sp. 8F]|uniref:M48 family metalloprotease n=1 Tax=unclassified Tsukamurella TaxID=2633480 RepID=UPI0023B8B2FF|nr:MULTISPECIES: M48 family metalloprotease [unclassified Tsukamurella]MDF0531628.1 M48 family metalloprotease [Tsukamurella sp. 8J]MDF0588804.1 M48 family metalloprotease [Tsukamurella sp. 8F]
MHATLNRCRTVALLGLPPVAMMLVGLFFGRIVLVVAMVGGIGVAAYVYLMSGNLALRAMHARRVSELQHPALYRVVRDLSTTARHPMPTLYVSPTRAPTAFAVGHNPGAASLCCTAGLLDALDERGLRAVVAHELAHVHHRETLVGSVAGALAAVLCGLSGFGYLVSGFDGVRRGAGDGAPRTPRSVRAALALLAPPAALIVRCAAPRACELHADERGAVLCADPEGLARALETLDSAARAAPLPPEPELVTQAHLMIVPPFRPDDAVVRRFSFHPPVAERTARLRAMIG